MILPAKRPPVRRRFVIDIGQRCYGGTTVLIQDENGGHVANFWSYGYNPSVTHLAHVMDLIARAIRLDLETRPPLDRRGRAPWPTPVDHEAPVLEH